MGHYPGSRKRGNDVPGRDVGYMPQVSVRVYMLACVYVCVCATNSVLAVAMHIMSLHFDRTLV